MPARECQECSRILRELQRAAEILRQAKLQNDDPLPDDPADWLGPESDQAITDMLCEIQREIARLKVEHRQHRAKDHFDSAGL